MDEIKFFKGDINNFDKITHDVNNFYVTSGSNDSDYRLYIGDKLLAQCGQSNDGILSDITTLFETKADKTEIPTKLSELTSDSQHRTVTDHDINQWNSYAGVVYSDDEFIVGKWIDGRNVYRHTIIFEEEIGRITTSTTSGDVRSYWAYTDALSGCNIDQFIKMEGTAFCKSDKHENGCWQPVPRIVPDACEDYSIGIGDFNLATGKVGVLFRCEIYLC